MRREIVSFAKLPLNVIARTLGHAEKNKLFASMSRRQRSLVYAVNL